jgi:hypothetical protein
MGEERGIMRRASHWLSTLWRSSWCHALINFLTKTRETGDWGRKHAYCPSVFFFFFSSSLVYFSWMFIVEMRHWIIGVGGGSWEVLTSEEGSHGRCELQRAGHMLIIKRGFFLVAALPSGRGGEDLVPMGAQSTLTSAFSIFKICKKYLEWLRF